MAARFLKNKSYFIVPYKIEDTKKFNDFLSEDGKWTFVEKPFNTTIS